MKRNFLTAFATLIGKQHADVTAMLKRMKLPVQRTKIGVSGAYRCGACVQSETLSKEMRYHEDVRHQSE